MINNCISHINTCQIILIFATTYYEMYYLLYLQKKDKNMYLFIHIQSQFFAFLCKVNNFNNKSTIIYLLNEERIFNSPYLFEQHQRRFYFAKKMFLQQFRFKNSNFQEFPLGLQIPPLGPRAERKGPYWFLASIRRFGPMRGSNRARTTLLFYANADNPPGIYVHVSGKYGTSTR